MLTTVRNPDAMAQAHNEMEFAVTILAAVCTGDDGKDVPVGTVADTKCPRGCTLANPCTALSQAKLTEEQWEMCAGSTTYQRSSISGKRQLPHPPPPIHFVFG